MFSDKTIQEIARRWTMLGAEIGRLRGLMFLVGKCDGDREYISYHPVCIDCDWCEDDHCAIDGWKMPDGEDCIR